MSKNWNFFSLLYQYLSHRRSTCSRSLLWYKIPTFLFLSCWSPSSGMPAQGLRLLYFVEAACLFHWIFKISLLQTLLSYTPFPWGLSNSSWNTSGHHDWIPRCYITIHPDFCLSKAHFHLNFSFQLLWLPDSTVLLWEDCLVSIPDITSYPWDSFTNLHGRTL